MLRGLMLVGALIFGMFFALAALPSIVSESEETRTQPAQDVGLMCATGALETSCAVTLTTPHQYATTAFMTVQETSPGSVDRTSTSSLAANRETVTVASLASGQAYVFTVDYMEKATNVSENLNDILRLMPLILIVGFVVLVLVVAAMTGSLPSLRR
jgi:hypothetical protein